LAEYAKHAEETGLKVIIAGAGGAAHLPGMIASHTIIPVIGVPILVYNDKHQKKSITINHRNAIRFPCCICRG
jgi:5-(carboxyamino)imidazole ribonucleotide mutase